MATRPPTNTEREKLPSARPGGALSSPRPYCGTFLTNLHMPFASEISNPLQLAKATVGYKHTQANHTLFVLVATSDYVVLSTAPLAALLSSLIYLPSSSMLHQDGCASSRSRQAGTGRPMLYILFTSGTTTSHLPQLSGGQDDISTKS